MHKIQQVCQQENENIRKEVQAITNKVRSLKNGREPTSGQEQDTNTGIVFDALCKEMNEKLDNLVKSQPEITKPVDEIYMLRRDTNTLLESQSVAKKQPDTTPPASENLPEGILEDKHVDEKQKSVLDNLPSRVAERNTRQSQ